MARVTTASGWLHGLAPDGRRSGVTRGEGIVTIGGSVALIIIGAILRFAITWTPQYINLQAMGVILMIGGVVGLGISVWLMFLRRRREMDTEVTEHRHYVEPRP